MRFLYQFGISLYALLLSFASVFNAKAKSMLQGQKRSLLQLKKNQKLFSKRPIWIHCASLGEFEMSRPILEHLKSNHPEHPILLSFFSPSGYEIRKDYELADAIVYLPLDKKQNAQKWVQYYNPLLAIFAKYEFWLNYTEALAQKDIPILSISSIFRPEQIFFKPHGGLFRSILKSFTHHFVQNQTSMDLLRSIQINNASLTGDTRFDQVKKNVSGSKKIQLAEQFSNGKTMVVGSAWPKDIEVLAPFVQKGTPPMKFIVAPHDITMSNIKKMEAILGVPCLKYSEANDKNIHDFQVLIIDNIGLLSSLYQYGHYAFIGGGYKEGLHNTLEAITFGLPVFFGDKKFQNFQEAHDMLHLKIGFKIATTTDLISTIKWLQTSENYALTKSAALRYVDGNIGATDKIMKFILPLIQNQE